MDLGAGLDSVKKRKKSIPARVRIPVGILMARTMRTFLNPIQK